MMGMDKWAAEKCGVELVLPYTGMKNPNFVYAGREYWHEWTMQDARCREIVREHFGISTSSMGSCGLWGWAVPRKGIQDESLHYECLKDAEIACIEAIMKADGNND